MGERKVRERDGGGMWVMNEQQTRTDIPGLYRCLMLRLPVKVGDYRERIIK